MVGMEEMKKYYVVFTAEVSGRLWYHRYLKDSFLHCFLLYVENIGGRNYAMKCEGLVNRVDILPIDLQGKGIEELIQTYITHCYNLGYKKPKVIEIKNNVDKYKNTSIRNCIPTCATFVKVFLGLRTFAFTPYMLYKFLVKDGHKRIF